MQEKEVFRRQEGWRCQASPRPNVWSQRSMIWQLVDPHKYQRHENRPKTRIESVMSVEGKPIGLKEGPKPDWWSLLTITTLRIASLRRFHVWLHFSIVWFVKNKNKTMLQSTGNASVANINKRQLSSVTCEYLFVLQFMTRDTISWHTKINQQLLSDSREKMLTLNTCFALFSLYTLVISFEHNFDNTIAQAKIERLRVFWKALRSFSGHSIYNVLT